ncbi:MAG: hypothetical protein MUE60_10255 [Candidatus Eisenbacteria bacterium]|jgi:hypothetical protein|nr:hypothetical protein [Candidatus Eisenbacteria bacterium]
MFDPAVLVPALLTLGVFSILYRENLVYRIIEHVGVGLAAGYALAMIIRTGLIPRILSAAADPVALVTMALAIPACVGIAVSSWRRNTLGTVGISVAASIAAGLALPGIVENLILEQMRATMVPIGLSSDAGFDSLVVAIGVLSTMAYFSFTREPRGIRGVAALTGLYTLMISFGASFGYAAMSRFTLLIGRFLFLLRDWLHLVR